MISERSRSRAVATFGVGLALLCPGSNFGCDTGSEAGSTESGEREAGSLQIHAGFADGAAPSKGSNSMVIQVFDATGLAILDANVALEPLMPAHGHGSTSAPTVMNLGRGYYRSDDVVLFMAGEWQITITATTVDDSGRAVISAQVPG